MSVSSCSSEDDERMEEASNGSGSEEVHSLVTRQDEVKLMQDLSRKETAFLRFWRLVVLVMLLVTGAMVSTATYFFLKNQEKDDYNSSYELMIQTITDSNKFQVSDFYRAQRNFAETVSSRAIASNQTWPFVTLGQFEVEAAHVRHEAALEIVAVAPIITNANFVEWRTYSNKMQGWLNESKQTLALHEGEYQADSYLPGTIGPTIYEFGVYGDPSTVHEASGPGPFLPLWHHSPPPFQPAIINYNMLAEGFVQKMFPVVLGTGEGITSEAMDLSKLAEVAWSTKEHLAFHKQYVDVAEGVNVNGYPHSVYLHPIRASPGSNSSAITAMLVSVFPWDRCLGKLLPEGISGIIAVLRNTCGQNFTYALEGARATYLGEGDFHDRDFENSKRQIYLSDFIDPKTVDVAGHCAFYFDIYSSHEFQSLVQSNLYVVFPIIVAAFFILMAFSFFMYDLFVQRRNAKVVNAAAKSNEILASVFPSAIRDRLFAEKDKEHREVAHATKNRLKNYLDDGDQGLGFGVDGRTKSKPIADLFPETTILFMDIVGFTAWSSVREPCQVFELLETLFQSFDEIAKRRRIFKVETVGDCYVAVCGLPDPRRDHAVAMARFARDALYRMSALAKKLETTLGPDTGDLSMRIGIHSGPVTAGVLRGERSRFQLFGDTMNTAARMESNGKPGQIQLSQETADLLVAAGKAGWIRKRDDRIFAKGKGELQTFWLDVEDRTDTVSSHGGSSGVNVTDTNCQIDGKEDVLDGYSQEASNKLKSLASGKTARLVEWNVDILQRLLKQVVARRGAAACEEQRPQFEDDAVTPASKGMTVLDEVKEIITLPTFDSNVCQSDDCENIDLGTTVAAQLNDFVRNVAAMYQENPFHNFEHASHVTMSVVKLLSRIVAPDLDVRGRYGDVASTLHDHTYGITSDPLTQFSCVLSALIHDIDHPGVPNTQLVKEETKLATAYRNKSIAEQNSVDLAWDLLMDSSYDELRATIYTNECEKRRFRQLVVNSVMATDIADKELKALRNGRWALAFSESAANGSDEEVINRKATIVIEHLIQASDVAHTMQHWHVYRKWNERFFIECYKAFREGRAENNPADTWYEGELGFFDFYIIPLAKKLEDCGVFGVSSDEYLNYATKNRQEWEDRGRQIVGEMVEMVNSRYVDSTKA